MFFSSLVTLTPQPSFQTLHASHLLYHPANADADDDADADDINADDIDADDADADDADNFDDNQS